MSRRIMPPLSYYWAQLRQSWAKRHKDTSFRTDPSIDLILSFTPLPSQARILCVGPRNGVELDAWEQRGYCQVDGIDLLGKVSDRRIRWGDMHGLRCMDSQFDLIYASHVFEHAWDFSKVAEEMIRILRPSGLLFAAFPIHFTPTSHDRYDFDSADGFLKYFDFARLIRLWHRETPTEVAVLARLEGK